MAANADDPAVLRSHDLDLDTTIAISRLRELTATHFVRMRRPCVITDKGRPIAAIIPYDVYLRFQGILKSAK